jgi:hypothetical protein
MMKDPSWPHRKIEYVISVDRSAWLACCPPGNLHSVVLKIREMIKAINQINESVKRPQAGPRMMQQLPNGSG